MRLLTGFLDGVQQRLFGRSFFIVRGCWAGEHKRVLNEGQARAADEPCPLLFLRDFNGLVIFRRFWRVLRKHTDIAVQCCRVRSGEEDEGALTKGRRMSLG